MELYRLINGAGPLDKWLLGAAFTQETRRMKREGVATKLA